MPCDAVCANAVAKKDPLCQHMGTLKAENTTTAEQCSACDCPADWAGAECKREFLLLLKLNVNFTVRSLHELTCLAVLES